MKHLKKQSTMTTSEYLIQLAIGTVIAMISYRRNFFLTISGLDIRSSKLILWIVAIVLVATGFFLTNRDRRDDLSLAVNIMLPYELYAAATYYLYYPGLVIAAVALSLVCSVAFIIIISRQDARLLAEKEQTKANKVKNCILTARSVSAFCMLILIFTIAFNTFFGYGLFRPRFQSVSSTSEASEWTIENKIDTVCLLREEAWQTLNSQEKMDVLGVILNIEINYLGLNHELYLNAAPLSGNLLAHYEHRKHQIVINADSLSFAPPEEVLNSLCHECYHSYQYQLVELYELTPDEYRNMLPFTNADSYIEELFYQEQGKLDFVTYERQKIEIDARRYAEDGVDEYYWRIAEYIAG